MLAYPFCSALGVLQTRQLPTVTIQDSEIRNLHGNQADLLRILV